MKYLECARYQQLDFGRTKCQCHIFENSCDDLVGRHEAEIASLRQARFDMSPTLSREGGRAPVPVYPGDRSTV